MPISFVKHSMARLVTGLALCLVFVSMLPPAQAPTSGTDAHTVYLTFDDGPSANTEKVLDILRSEQVSATFFITGAETEHGVALYNRIVEEGHTLGLHTYTHNANQIYSSLDGFTRDFEKLSAWVLETTGTVPRVCRMVGGSNTKYCPAILREQILTYLVESDYSCYDWDIDAHDSGAYATPAWKLSQSIIADAKKMPGQDLIILLHDDALRTTLPDALREVIAYFREAGYHFAALREDTESVKRILPKNHAR